MLVAKDGNSFKFSFYLILLLLQLFEGNDSGFHRVSEAVTEVIFRLWYILFQGPRLLYQVTSTPSFSVMHRASWHHLLHRLARLRGPLVPQICGVREVAKGRSGSCEGPAAGKETGPSLGGAGGVEGASLWPNLLHKRRQGNRSLSYSATSKQPSGRLRIHSSLRTSCSNVQMSSNGFLLSKSWWGSRIQTKPHTERGEVQKWRYIQATSGHAVWNTECKEISSVPRVGGERTSERRCLEG